MTEKWFFLAQIILCGAVAAAEPDPPSTSRSEEHVFRTTLERLRNAERSRSGEVGKTEDSPLEDASVITEGFLLTIRPLFPVREPRPSPIPRRPNVFYSDEAVVLEVELKNATSSELTLLSREGDLDFAFHVRTDSGEVAPGLRYGKVLELERAGGTGNPMTIQAGKSIRKYIAISRQFDMTLRDKYLVTAFQAVLALDGDDTKVIQSNTLVVEVRD